MRSNYKQMTEYTAVMIIKNMVNHVEIFCVEEMRNTEKSSIQKTM